MGGGGIEKDLFVLTVDCCARVCLFSKGESSRLHLKHKALEQINYISNLLVGVMPHALFVYRNVAICLALYLLKKM